MKTQRERDWEGVRDRVTERGRGVMIFKHYAKPIPTLTEFRLGGGLRLPHRSSECCFTTMAAYESPLGPGQCTMSFSSSNSSSDAFPCPPAPACTPPPGKAFKSTLAELRGLLLEKWLEFRGLVVLAMRLDTSARLLMIFTPLCLLFSTRLLA